MAMLLSAQLQHYFKAFQGIALRAGLYAKSSTEGYRFYP